MVTLGFALALLVGLSLGLLGGGGSILTVPIFVYVLGYAAKPAVAMSLPVVGITSLVGAFSHWRAGNVHLRTAALFGAVAMGGAYAGARLSALFSDTALLLLFAVVMLAAAIAMHRRRDPSAAAPVAAAVRPVPLVLAAAGMGLLTGLVGIGGGFLAVPALVVIGRLPMKQAIGTSLVVIAMNAAAGSFGYRGQVEVDWAFAGAFSAVAIVGILAGTRLVTHVPAASLRKGFAVFLLVMGAFILAGNLGVAR